MVPRARVARLPVGPYEVERHEGKCDKCKKELYLDAAAAVYKCPACETKDAEDGVYGRTDLGEGCDRGLAPRALPQVGPVVAFQRFEHRRAVEDCVEINQI